MSSNDHSHASSSSSSLFPTFFSRRQPEPQRSQENNNNSTSSFFLSPSPSSSSSSTSSDASSIFQPLTQLFSSSPKSPSPTTTSSIPPLISDLPAQILASPTATIILTATIATTLSLGGVVAYRRLWKRIRNSEAVPGGMIDRKEWIRGVVTSVGDGDNFRLFHTPGPFFSYPFKFRSVPSVTKELQNETIHIRISDIDAPESAHFGRPSQPHSQESLDWLRSTLLGNKEGLTGRGRKMRVRLLRRDQYGRIVGLPYISSRIPFLKGTALPIEMLKKGMAVVYESGGAEYEPWGLKEMKRLEGVAKQQKVGLWSLPPSESPAEYKKRYKLEESSTATSTASSSVGEKTNGGWLARKVLGFFRGSIWRGEPEGKGKK